MSEHASKSEKAREAAIADAQAKKELEAEAVAAAQADPSITPDATYLQGTPGVNPDTAVPAEAPVVSTYEDALEAGYYGVTPGYANTEKMSVSAVTARDKAQGLPGTSGKEGATINGAGKDATKTQ